MRRRGVLALPPGALSNLMRELELNQGALRVDRGLLARAESGAPLRSSEVARLEKALMSAALGGTRHDHRSGLYNQLKAQIRRGLPSRPYRV